MKNVDMITVLTPSYNRANLLEKLYNSLLEQKDQNYIWLIIDDGSTDNTKELVDKWIRENKNKIKNVFQKNQGKHVALNTGIALIDTDATFIVDSDDVLTNDAIASIRADWKYVKDNDLCGISYLRGYDENTCIGDQFYQDYMIDTFTNVRINNSVKGDKAEVWRTDLLKQNPFPVFQGEKFFGEGYVWGKLAQTHKMLHINKIIYITKYLDQGLTKSGRALRIRCPKGGQLNAKEGLRSELRLKVRIKHAILYDCYSFFDNQNILNAIRRSGYVSLVSLCIPLGYLLYKYWKIRYGD